MIVYVLIIDIRPDSDWIGIYYRYKTLIVIVYVLIIDVRPDSDCIGIYNLLLSNHYQI